MQSRSLRVAPQALSLALGLALGTVASAHAQEHSPALDDPYFGVELMLGFAGKVSIEAGSVEIGDATVTASNADSEDFDAEVGIGGGIRYMHPLHRYFALGARIAVQTWRSDSNADTGRNVAFDLSLIPQGRVPLSRTVELYLAVPIGLTLDLLNEIDAAVNFPNLMTGASVDADPGFGWNLAFMFGSRFAVSRDVGLFAEIGYALHSVSHDVHSRLEVVGGAGEVVASFDVLWSQVALNVGVSF
jgi:hypothetical protein